jgi:hypothetical protein
MSQLHDRLASLAVAVTVTFIFTCLGSCPGSGIYHYRRPDFYHRIGIGSGVALWPAGLRAETGGFAH